jgi:UDP-N-acetyl-2-amino-2-deoxyglucuronate dehydrogenase
MKEIRVGIIGCGVVAPTHVACFQQHPGVTVAWACDLIESKAHALAARYGIARVTTRFADVVSDAGVDLISICTDHASHAPIAIAALRAGKHVLCEKALAHTSEALSEMLAAGAARPDLVFAGVFQHRFDAINQRVRELILAGALGRMLTAGVQMRCLRTEAYYRADAWRGTWEHEGGAVLINQAIHYIDLLSWMMGGAQRVTAMHANLTHGDSLEAEDTAVAAITFASGALGTIEATCSSHIDWEPTLHFHGARGSIELRHDRPVKVLFAAPGETARVQAELSACQGAVVAGPGKSYYGSGHDPQIADVLEAIRAKRAPFVTARSAAETVELVLGLYRSFRVGQPVALAP